MGKFRWRWMLRRNFVAVLFFGLTACSSSVFFPPPPTEEVDMGLTERTALPLELATDALGAPTAALVLPTETLPPTTPTQPVLPTQTLISVTATTESGGAVTGIILFIGDGMGVYQRLGGQWLAHGEWGTLAMDTMPVLGFAETASGSAAVTDSAAAGTALATGQSTYNGAIGVAMNGDLLTTILEQAQAQGWATGLVTTTDLAHATPATFATHTSTRKNMLEIARQMMAAGVDVLLGGGEDDFLPGGEPGCYPEPGHRGDGINLIENALALGYTHVCTAEALAAVDTARVDRLLGFFGDQGMPTPYAPTLAEMTRVAIEILSRNENGFFLMVEGGQIDWEGHDNEAERVMQNVVGLDAAVVQAQIYALGAPNTLVIVTADHETGGMSLNFDGSGNYRQDGPFAMPDGTPFYVTWEHGHHSAANVPVTAQGPYSEFLAGTYPNTFIYTVMAMALYGVGR